MPTVPQKPSKDDIYESPDRGGGIVDPLDKSQVNYRRRNETTQQRINRLEAKLADRGGKDANLEARIKKLKERLAGGEVKPSDPSQDRAPNAGPRVQLDDDPTTWTPEMLAELAPPPQITPQFYDNANSSDKVKLGRKIDELNDEFRKPGDGTPQGPEMKRIRQTETTQERITRLQAKLKGASPEKKANLKKRIEALKKRRDAGETKPYEEKPKETPKPTSNIKNISNTSNVAKNEPSGDKKDKPAPTQKERNETRRNETLEERLRRLKEKLKTATGEAKKDLEKRIADLEARIRAGDTKGSSVKNQPGTPDRPFRNRGVSYKPLSYGGQLRI